MSLCNIPSKNYCEKTSTNCTDTNNTIECKCKDGYETDPFSHMSCQGEFIHIACWVICHAFLSSADLI